VSGARGLAMLLVSDHLQLRGHEYERRYVSVVRLDDEFRVLQVEGVDQDHLR